MSAPTTAFLDNFHRADSTGLGSNWTELVAPGEALPNIVSNQAVNTLAVTTNSAYWNKTTFAGDCETWYLWDATQSTPTEVDCWLRLGGTLPTSSNLVPTIGYDLNLNASTGSLSLLKANGSGGVTQIGSTITGLTGMSGIWLRLTGTTLTGYVWTGRAWMPVIQATDATFTSAGFCGFEFGNGAGICAMNQFGGGNPVAVNAFPSTGFLDPLNRTENPLSDGGKWTNIVNPGVGNNNLKDDGSTAISTAAAIGGAWWNAATFTNCECYATIHDATNTIHWILYVRISNGGTSTVTGYSCDFNAGILTISRIDSSSSTTILANSVPCVVAAGDQIGILVIGSWISVYLNENFVAAVHDTTYAGPGNIGISTEETTVGAGFSFFGGGTTSLVGFPFAAPTGFPHTGILDVLNRTENPLSDGGKWSQPVTSLDGTTTVKDDGTTAITVTDASPGGAWWNPTLYTNSEAYAQVGVSGATDWFLYLRILNGGTSIVTGYGCLFGSASATGIIFYTNDAVPTQAQTIIFEGPSPAFSANDQLGIGVTGNILVAYVNGVAWGAVANSKYTIGNIGMGMEKGVTGQGLFNFGGGEFSLNYQALFEENAPINLAYEGRAAIIGKG